MSPDLLRALVALGELLAKVTPHIIDLIESHGSLSAEEKAELTARVEATRAAVKAYEPRPKRD